jgi:hypothetical protein
MGIQVGIFVFSVFSRFPIGDPLLPGVLPVPSPVAQVRARPIVHADQVARHGVERDALEGSPDAPGAPWGYPLETPLTLPGRTGGVGQDRVPGASWGSTPWLAYDTGTTSFLLLIDESQDYRRGFPGLRNDCTIGNYDFYHINEPCERFCDF